MRRTRASAGRTCVRKPKTNTADTSLALYIFSSFSFSSACARRRRRLRRAAGGQHRCRPAGARRALPASECAARHSQAHRARPAAACTRPAAPKPCRTFGTLARPGCRTSMTCAAQRRSATAATSARHVARAGSPPRAFSLEGCSSITASGAAHKLLARQQLVGHELARADRARLLPHGAWCRSACFHSQLPGTDFV